MATPPPGEEPAPASKLIDMGDLRDAYYRRQPDSGDPRQAVDFGTRGHWYVADCTFIE